ncbi:MAG: glycosyltransferase [Vibrionaceae bacterium]|nr:glycosyltransferase [Vibrionaceae bacterium]
MKILFGTDIIFGKSSGEVYHVLGVLNSWASNSEVKVSFYTHECNIALLKNLGIDSKVNLIPFYSSIMKKGLFKKIGYFFSLRNYLKKHDFDVLYLRSTFWSKFYSFIHDSNVFYTIEYNGLLEKEMVGWKQYLIPFAKFLMKKEHSTSNLNIVVAGGIAHYYKLHDFLDNWNVIHNGMNANDLDIIEALGEVNRNNDFIFVGNLAKWQNFDNLISFWLNNNTSLSARGVKLHIVGGGSQRDMLAKLIKENDLENSVVLHGPLYGEEMYSLLRSCQFGLILDERLYEGKLLFSPLKHFQYQACGLRTLYLSDSERIDPEGLDISIVKSSDKVNLEKLSYNNKFDSEVRTWNVVSAQLVKLIKAKVDR